MKAAFEQLRYDVFLIAGTGPERRRAIQTLKKQIRQGIQFDFVYSEPPSAPIAVVNHDILNLWLDIGFLRWCHQENIPVGLFYRDVYWRFDVYKKNTAWHQRLISVPLFWFEWLSYRRWVNHLFLPSQEMIPALPSNWPTAHLSALPPGCEPTLAIPRFEKLNDQLELFYVGGITPPLYDLTPMFVGLNGLDGVRLTLCCREAEWQQVRSFYQPSLSAQVRVIHVHGAELATYYAQADVFGLFRQHHPYLEFAMPIKVFEALGYGLPIITTTGAAAAEMIQQEGIGWVVSKTSEFRDLVIQLQTEPARLFDTRQRATQVRQHHTWLERARTVVETLRPIHEFNKAN